MKILIPMAGHGDRFIAAGYKDPKPLIKVNGKRIIEYVVEMFSPDDEFVFICDEGHLKNTNMLSVLSDLPIKNRTVLGIESHSDGPVHTILQVQGHFSDDEELIVCYCDNPYLWDYETFKKHVKDTIIIIIRAYFYIKFTAAAV